MKKFNLHPKSLQGKSQFHERDKKIKNGASATIIWFCMKLIEKELIGEYIVYLT